MPSLWICPECGAPLVEDMPCPACLCDGLPCAIHKDRVTFCEPDCDGTREQREIERMMKANRGVAVS